MNIFFYFIIIMVLNTQGLICSDKKEEQIQQKPMQASKKIEELPAEKTHKDSRSAHIFAIIEKYDFQNQEVLFELTMNENVSVNKTPKQFTRSFSVEAFRDQNFKKKIVFSIGKETIDVMRNMAQNYFEEKLSEAVYKRKLLQIDKKEDNSLKYNVLYGIRKLFFGYGGVVNNPGSEKNNNFCDKNKLEEANNEEGNQNNFDLSAEKTDDEKTDDEETDDEEIDDEEIDDEKESQIKQELIQDRRKQFIKKLIVQEVKKNEKNEEDEKTFALRLNPKKKQNVNFQEKREKLSMQRKILKSFLESFENKVEAKNAEDAQEKFKKKLYRYFEEQVKLDLLQEKKDQLTNEQSELLKKDLKQHKKDIYLWIKGHGKEDKAQRAVRGIGLQEIYLYYCFLREKNSSHKKDENFCLRDQYHFLEVIGSKQQNKDVGTIIAALDNKKKYNFLSSDSWVLSDKSRKTARVQEFKILDFEEFKNHVGSVREKSQKKLDVNENLYKKVEDFFNAGSFNINDLEKFNNIKRISRDRQRGGADKQANNKQKKEKNKRCRKSKAKDVTTKKRFLGKNKVKKLGEIYLSEEESGQKEEGSSDEENNNDFLESSQEQNRRIEGYQKINSSTSIYLSDDNRSGEKGLELQKNYTTKIKEEHNNNEDGIETYEDYIDGYLNKFEKKETVGQKEEID